MKPKLNPQIAPMNADKTKTMSPTKQVPVAVAQDIARVFEKSQVIILAFDPVSELTTTTTFGVTAFDKENAAAGGEMATKAIGCDLSQKQVFEDFHNDYNPAFYKEAKDLLFKLSERHDGPPDLMAHVYSLCARLKAQSSKS